MSKKGYCPRRKGSAKRFSGPQGIELKLDYKRKERKQRGREEKRVEISLGKKRLGDKTSSVKKKEVAGVDSVGRHASAIYKGEEWLQGTFYAGQESRFA